MESLDIREIVLQWFTNSLLERKQRDKYLSFLNAHFTIDDGVILRLSQETSVRNTMNMLDK